MENEIVQVFDLEKLQERTPFLIHLPHELELRNVTYRNEGRKWATLRFECAVDGESLRVKEFFLDWFYPGFPKSLMNSFISSYSSVDSAVMGDGVIFYGKNYKGKDASSAFSLGTQIEVEGENKLNVKKLSELMHAPFDNERFRNYPFYKRSFFANNGKPEWFEEERITNLSWKAPSRKFCVGGLCLDSVGNRTRDGSLLQAILVFSEEYYRRAAWVDIARMSSGEKHLVYEFRKGGNFFDEFEEGDVSLAYRRDTGLSIARFTLGPSLVTISLSPLFQMSEVKSVIRHLKERLEDLEKLENLI
jgi:hypothetical protein